MEKNKDYWNGLEEFEKTDAYVQGLKKEFPEDLGVEEALSEESLGLKSNRRDFLKLFGFGVTAATLSACETPVKHAIPYVIKPETVTPGVASYYATTCRVTNSVYSILVKTREGRPIKIEGNPKSPLGLGGTCAVGQSSLLSLYNNDRVKAPVVNGGEVKWDKFDEAFKAAVAAKPGKVVVVSEGNVGPTADAVIDKYLEQFGENGMHLSYDSCSMSSIAIAHENNFKKRATPNYHFDKAEVIVSLDADFLGTWVSPVQFTKGYSKGRKLNPKNPVMSQHFQFESCLSLTGTNADWRLPVDSSKMNQAVVSLYNKVASLAGEAPIDSSTFDVAGNMISRAANALWAKKGKGLVVCGLNDTAVQEIINGINNMLGNYGTTIDIAKASLQGASNEGELTGLIAGMKSGEVSTVILNQVNPAYNFPGGSAFSDALKNVPNRMAITLTMDETASMANFVCPTNHFLESWGDNEPIEGFYTLTQPAIRPIFNTRQAEESFMAWMDKGESDEEGKTPPKGTDDKTSGIRETLMKNWETTIFKGNGTFSAFWTTSLQNGFFNTNTENDNTPAYSGDVVTAAGKLDTPKDGLDVVLYQKVGIRDGQNANAAWLQELPDPITKVCWDNYVLVPYKYAKTNNLSDGQLITVSAGGYSLELPAVVMPGMAPNTFGISLGYGRTKAGIVGNNIGGNAFPFLTVKDGTTRYRLSGATVSAPKGTYPLAKTQTFMGYEMGEKGTYSLGFVDEKMTRVPTEDRISSFILKDGELSDYRKNRKAGNENRDKIAHHNTITLWDKHDKKGNHWAMAIDLNACTGCGNCIVACHSENNVPMVGKQEVATRREMHWMRIDRYFKGNPEAEDGSLEIAHQPVMCQHCDNAPCETVCPVLATVHSDEGLNQQVYNRCIGTRYCANNCPYKVRRFNWFSYYSNEKFNSEERNAPNHIMFDEVGKMTLNPDVTVRARGVMEKCSFCVQRLQAGKLEAKAEGRIPKDGEIKTACQQSCPADAIVFGNLNDSESEISKLVANERAYHALEEVKTQPAVSYLTKIRNKS